MQNENSAESSSEGGNIKELGKMSAEEEGKTVVNNGPAELDVVKTNGGYHNNSSDGDDDGKEDQNGDHEDQNGGSQELDGSPNNLEGSVSPATALTTAIQGVEAANTPAINNAAAQGSLQTDPQKSAFMAPSKVEEFMPAMQQQQVLQQQQQQMYQTPQQQAESELLKFNSAQQQQQQQQQMDYNFRSAAAAAAAAGPAGIMPQQPQQMPGGSSNGGHNNWGTLDDINNINYGQPPPGHNMAAAAGMMAAGPPGGMQHQMAAMRRSLPNAGGYQQQQYRQQQPQQAYPGQQNQFMINRGNPYGAAAAAATQGWPNCTPNQNSWSTGMPPPGMAGMAMGGGWNRQRMGGAPPVHPQQRNKMMGGSMAMGGQYMGGRRKPQGYPNSKMDMMGNDDGTQVCNVE